MPVYNDFGKFILRFSVGFLMLFHGIAKLIHGVSFIKMTLSNAGLPQFLAYGAYVGEFLAPLFLILGFMTRASAATIIFTMIMAIYLVHSKDLFAITQTGAWAIEVAAFYILTSIVIILVGPGKYSIDKK